ncbi:AraC family transcriptional regulator [Polaromonas sp. AET17H-212]|uniref:AraC family transcriptional regulator n=1 Tax=Polaromonas sp. AET17H-212 TaxID=1977061 RepID=UPI000BBC5AD4|nr:helix-turn-helix transcriptional regulator [Polaromonas sp. AET17H-212]
MRRRPTQPQNSTVLVSADGIGAFVPSRQRPVRVRTRNMPADTHFEPHRHAWAQLAYCATGIVQVTASTPEEVTYIVPPSRAVWIAPGALHTINVLEAAEFRTLYIDASARPAGWDSCRVLVVSPLLREVIHALDSPRETLSVAREQRLAGLVLDELTRADTQALGVPMPNAQTGDKRLRALCEAVLRAPSERATLAGWAADMGASERTMARLFREELGTSYQQWRQQAILAHALPLLARGTPVSQVAAASGYASDSAFSAMFKAAMGQSPSHFQNKNGL